ncbi:MAG: glutathione S-transferase N-terminal domain-containing protein [Alphaproteobacteria bacterium]
MARLYTLPPSHFCERARWALDHSGRAYVERRWAVGLHGPLARRLAPETSLPILDIGGGVIQGSGGILDWCGTPGGDRVLERRLEHVVGPLVRRYVYSATLHDPASGVRRVLTDGVPHAQAFVVRLGWPILRRAMAAGLDARPERLPELESALDAELAHLELRLGGERHLVGGRFGRADLTAASLLAPLARPAECPLYRRVVMAEPLGRVLAAWENRPALAWVRSIYVAHRRSPA